MCWRIQPGSVGVQPMTWPKTSVAFKPPDNGLRKRLSAKWRSILFMPAAKTLKTIDFFCGAGGMSYGFQQAGIQVLAGIDNAQDCKNTYLANIKGAQYIERDINYLSVEELKKIIKINDPNMIFIGCSPCQFWSKIRTDKSKSIQTSNLLEQFQSFVKYFKPGFVIIENVPGLKKRNTESILPSFVSFLSSAGYAWKDDIINTNHYGVPQQRMRYLLIASRLHRNISLPKADINKRLTVQDVIGQHNGFPLISAGHRDLSPLLHTAASLSPQNIERIKRTPKSGGNRMAWASDENLQIPTYKGRDSIFRDVYGRMAWDKPAPTITTRFNSLSNGRFGHPEEDRAISMREGATLQTFPNSYIFYGSSQCSLARQIGNAVPPELARRIGLHIKAVHNNG